MKLFNLITIDLQQILYPIIYIILGFISYGIIKRIINRVIYKTSKNPKLNLKNHQQQKANTIRIVILNIVKYIIVILVILAILSVFGLNVKSIVAGLGITTAILGLAFQDLAKDFIAGISIITENQYEVGDTIEFEGFMGEVVFLGLKTTRIRDYKGATKIIANHKMDTVINYSLHNSLAIVDVNVAYEHNPEDVELALNEIAKTLEGKVPSAKNKIEVWGLDQLEDSEMVYRIVVEVAPMAQYTAQRFLRKEIKKGLDERNIKIPYPQIEVHNGK